MKISKGSSYEKIIKCMQSNPYKKWMVADFTKGHRFIWYEAGTRISDMVRQGYVESEKIKGTRFCNYSLTDKWLEFIPEKYAIDCSYLFQDKEKFDKENAIQFIGRVIKSIF